MSKADMVGAWFYYTAFLMSASVAPRYADGAFGCYLCLCSPPT